ncbi:MAG: phosphoribosyl-ATP diphosphatase [Chloroflexota bacterium]|nr:phosphoribosyl-ATP diphosphatase [Chloroflexota bacterium]
MQDMFDELQAIIAERRRNPVAGSYTGELLAGGRAKIAQKVGEEAVEVVIAALSQGRDEQLNELADLSYHLLVLMSELDISLDDLRQRLRERHQARASR